MLTDLNQFWERYRAVQRALQPEGLVIHFTYDGEARRVIVTAWGPDLVRGWDLNRQAWRTFKRVKMQGIIWPE